jgi:hypothetical protein
MLKPVGKRERRVSHDTDNVCSNCSVWSAAAVLVVLPTVPQAHAGHHGPPHHKNNHLCDSGISVRPDSGKYPIHVDIMHDP